ncbi:MAG: aldo/keto reductase [Actinomycetota bacterium]|jgi:aryl-alcohol dehydrogenase-like predicted oxidoreductase
MRTRRLGAHGPEISVIGLGAWEAGGDAWGANPADDDVVRAFHGAFDAGITWVDTAEVYGSGESERLVGKAVAGRRDDIVVASKVAPSPEGTGFRPEQVRAACDASLGRLGIDALDVYQLHWPDETGVPVEETWGAMAELVDAGKTKAIGVSNFDQELLERCLPIHHVDSLQQEFSMLALEDRGLIRWCGEAGIGVVTYSPLGVGFLTGRYTRDDAEKLDDWRGDDEWTTPERLDETFRVVDGLRPIAERVGVSMGELALAWNIAQPGVTAAIAGSRSATHLRANAAAGDLRLEPDVLDEIETLLG